MNALETIIRGEISARGPMRFDRFMELALYHPEHGYYAAPRAIGRGGDFITSVSVGPLFGRFLARQAAQMARLLGEPAFAIIEQGAHDGRLARDILEESRTLPEFFGRLRYVIVEPSEKLQAAQRHALADFADRVNWIANFDSWTGEKLAGLFFSNELVDAFPVRLIERVADEWFERSVALGEDGTLAWCTVKAEEEIRAAIGELPLPAAAGYRTEINLAARGWMTGVGRFLRRGYVITIDYGFPASSYYAPFRGEGTLTCYRGHRRDDDVLRRPGEQDLTAHVDFTALVRTGRSEGWEPLALVDQGRFLTGILQGMAVETEQPLDGERENREFKMLTHPEHLGARFQVLVQGKDAPAGLDGLAFARPGGFD